MSTVVTAPVYLLVPLASELDAAEWFRTARADGVFACGSGLARTDLLDMPTSTLIVSSDGGRRYVVQPERVTS